MGTVTQHNRIPAERIRAEPAQWPTPGFDRLEQDRQAAIKRNQQALEENNRRMEQISRASKERFERITRENAERARLTALQRKQEQLEREGLRKKTADDLFKPEKKTSGALTNKRPEAGWNDPAPAFKKKLPYTLYPSPDNAAAEDAAIRREAQEDWKRAENAPNTRSLKYYRKVRQYRELKKDDLVSKAADPRNDPINPTRQLDKEKLLLDLDTDIELSKFARGCAAGSKPDYDGILRQLEQLKALRNR